MLIEAVSRPVRYRFRDGRELLFAPGHPRDLPEGEAFLLLARTKGNLRPANQTSHTPIPPVFPGWIVCWRDQAGQLKGGADARQDGTVRSCRRIGSQWVVELTTGAQVLERQIVGVASTNASGLITAAWTVRDHGLNGREQRGPTPAYHLGERVTVHSLDGSVWTGQVMAYQHEPTGQGTLAGHWCFVEQGTRQAWVHESLLRKSEQI